MSMSISEILEGAGENIEREMAIDAMIDERGEDPENVAKRMDDYHQRHLSILSGKKERIRASLAVDLQKHQETAERHQEASQRRIDELMDLVRDERSMLKEIKATATGDEEQMKNEAARKVEAIMRQERQHKAYLKAGGVDVKG